MSSVDRALPIIVFRFIQKEGSDRENIMERVREREREIIQFGTREISFRARK